MSVDQRDYTIKNETQCKATSWHITYAEFHVWAEHRDWLHTWDSLPIYADNGQLHAYLTPLGNEVRVLVSDTGKIKTIERK